MIAPSMLIAKIQSTKYLVLRERGQPMSAAEDWTFKRMLT